MPRTHVDLFTGLGGFSLAARGAADCRNEGGRRNTMPALNFQGRFAPLVESGEKTQTIRPPRKRPICAGDTLHLYTGMRTRACRKLGEAFCYLVSPIIVNEECCYLDGLPLNDVQAERIAQRDGFTSWRELAAWFKAQYGLPFNGVLIRWEMRNAIRDYRRRWRTSSLDTEAEMGSVR